MSIISTSTTDRQLENNIRQICEELGVQFEFDSYAPEHALHFLHCESVEPAPRLPVCLNNVVLISDAYSGVHFQQLIDWGVRDCMSRPLNRQHLEGLIHTAVSRHGVKASTRTSDPSEMSWIERAKRVAPRSSTVLMTGQTGVGKNHLARNIHLESKRAGRLVVVNCGGINADLIESELFGHVKGAFTGAQSDHRGFFEQANDGTLMLDEINSLPLHLQSRLLHVVEEGEITPVGAEQSIPFQGRLLVSSNQPLKELVDAGSFREDLYFRLNVVSLEIPPLCERREEILPLFRSMLQAGFEHDLRFSLSVAAERVLFNYHWPGNIRQLKNAIEYLRAYCMSEVVMPEHLPPELTVGLVAESEPDRKFFEHKKHLESNRPSPQVLRNVLHANDNNRSAAARALGVSRTTFYKWLRANNITVGATVLT